MNTHKVCLGCNRDIGAYTTIKKVCNTCASKERRERLRRAVVRVFGRECWVCGYKGDIDGKLMDWHHLRDKNFSIGNQQHRQKRNVLIQEIEKCVRLCCLCHRKLHYEYIDHQLAIDAHENWWKNKTLKDVCEEFRQASWPPSHTRTYNQPYWEPSTAGKCLDCGTSIWHTAARCRKCYLKSIEKIDWPDTKELIDMVNKTSREAVGRKLGVTGNSVKKRILRHPAN